MPSRRLSVRVEGELSLLFPKPLPGISLVALLPYAAVTPEAHGIIVRLPLGPIESFFFGNILCADVDA